MDKEYYVFYSWQSYRPKDNKELIRKYINDALNSIREKYSLDVRLIEATSNRYEGAIDIPDNIMNNIKKSKVFIGDFSIINSECDTCEPMINNNVAIETGYAAGVLGWSRIMLLFNQKLHDKVDGVPFDTKHRHLFTFTLEQNNQGAKGDIVQKITEFVYNAIISGSCNCSDLDDIERSRDLRTLKDLFSEFDCYEMDQFIDGDPYYLRHYILDYGNLWQEKTSVSYFYIYDKTLRQLLSDFSDKLRLALNHGCDYCGCENRPLEYIFYGLESDVFISDKYEERFQKIIQEKTDLKEAYNKFITYIKDNYSEIDLQILSTEARQKVIENYKDILSRD